MGFSKLLQLFSFQIYTLSFFPLQIIQYFITRTKINLRSTTGSISYIFRILNSLINMGLFLMRNSFLVFINPIFKLFFLTFKVIMRFSKFIHFFSFKIYTLSFFHLQIIQYFITCTYVNLRTSTRGVSDIFRIVNSLINMSLFLMRN
jgi:hypothetical protein